MCEHERLRWEGELMVFDGEEWVLADLMICSVCDLDFDFLRGG